MTPSPRTSKFATLEIGRFLAASLVCIAHVIGIINGDFAHRGQHIFGGWQPPQPLPLNVEGFFIYTGELAVQYFFVLSGFVMATAHFSDFGHLGAVPLFWWRRICRIYPAYWLALLLTACAIHLHWTISTGLRNILLDPWQGHDTLFTSWTLRWEIVFYFGFSLCLLPWIGKPLLMLWAALCLWQWCPQPLLYDAHLDWPRLTSLLLAAPGSRFVSYLEFYFFAGLAAGAAAMRFRPGPRCSSGLLAAGLIAAALVLLPLHNLGPYAAAPARVLPLALSIATIILGVAGLERHNILPRLPNAHALGATSYPLYILHVPIVVLLTRMVPKRLFTTPELYCLGFAIIILVFSAAGLATMLFDQPLQKWLRPHHPAASRSKNSAPTWRRRQTAGRSR